MADYITDKIEYNSNIYKFQDNVSGYTKNIGTVTNVNLNGTSVATSGAAQLAITQLTNIIYPVGCYYETSDSTFNPQTAWGGTWELEDAGLTHIGANTNNPIVDASITMTMYNHTFDGWINNITDGSGKVSFTINTMNDFIENYFDDFSITVGNYGTIALTNGWADKIYSGDAFQQTCISSSNYIIIFSFDGSNVFSFELKVNLLNNPTADAGQSHTTYPIADFNLNTSLIAGQIYTITAKINTSSERKSIGFSHSGGTYIVPVPYNSVALIPIQSDSIYSVVFVATDEMATQTSGSGHGFIRIYASNFENAQQGSTTVTGTANVDWIMVEEGCRLGAIGGNTLTTYKPNYTVANHTLTLTEMPSHTHTASKQGYSFTLGSYQSSTSSTGSLVGVVTASTNVTGTQATGISSIFPRTSQTAGMSYLTINSAHTHASYGKDGGHNHNFVGNSTSVSTMQPYVVVNRWHRIA